MPDHETVTPAQLLELARLRGFALDPAEAEALSPTLESLARRLATIGAALPPDAEPVPPPRPER